MANKKQQTINKRNRERAVAEKRALKIQRKQEKREAARNGEPMPSDELGTPAEPTATPAEPTATPAEPPADVG